MPTLERDGDVFILNLGDDENRFNPPWVDAVTAALDEVEGAAGPKALVTTATGKFWSNGLDLAWIGENLDIAQGFIDTVHELFARQLLLAARRRSPRSRVTASPRARCSRRPTTSA